ncbi:unnamed protein product, partial [Musa hybrid cultivar]
QVIIKNIHTKETLLRQILLHNSFPMSYKKGMGKQNKQIYHIAQIYGLQLHLYEMLLARLATRSMALVLQLEVSKSQTEPHNVKIPNRSLMEKLDLVIR